MIVDTKAEIKAKIDGLTKARNAAYYRARWAKIRLGIDSCGAAKLARFGKKIETINRDLAKLRVKLSILTGTRKPKTGTWIENSIREGDIFSVRVTAPAWTRLQASPDRRDGQ